MVSRWLVGSQSTITQQPTLTAGLNFSRRNNCHNKNENNNCNNSIDNNNNIVYDTKFFINLLGRAFRAKKNGVYFIVIAVLVAE